MRDEGRVEGEGRNDDWVVRRRRRLLVENSDVCQVVGGDALVNGNFVLVTPCVCLNKGVCSSRVDPGSNHGKISDAISRHAAVNVGLELSIGGTDSQSGCLICIGLAYSSISVGEGQVVGGRRVGWIVYGCRIRTKGFNRINLNPPLLSDWSARCNDDLMKFRHLNVIACHIPG